MKNKEWEKRQRNGNQSMKSYLMVQSEMSGQDQFRLAQQNGKTKKPKAFSRKITAIAAVILLVLGAAGAGVLHEWPLIGSYSLIPGVGIADNSQAVWLLPNQEIAPFEMDDVTYEIRARYYHSRDVERDKLLYGESAKSGQIQVDLMITYQSDQEEEIKEIEEWVQTNQQQILSSQMSDRKKPSLIQGLEEKTMVRVKSADHELLGSGFGNLECSRIGNQFVFKRSTRVLCDRMDGGSILVELPSMHKEIPITFAPAEEYHYLRSLGTVRKWGDAYVVIRQKQKEQEDVALQIYSLLSLGDQPDIWINPYRSIDSSVNFAVKEWQPYLIDENQEISIGLTKSNGTDYYFPDAPKGQKYQLVIPKVAIIKMSHFRERIDLKLDSTKKQWPLSIPITLNHAKVILNQAECSIENADTGENRVDIQGVILREDAGYALTGFSCISDDNENNDFMYNLYMMPVNEHYMENGTEEQQADSKKQKQIKGSFYFYGNLPDQNKLQIIMESYQYDQPFTYSFVP